MALLSGHGPAAARRALGRLAALGTLATAAATAAAVTAPLPLPAQARTQDQALAHAFPNMDIERRTAYLDPAEQAQAARAAGSDVEVEAAIVTYYVARRQGEPRGVAYFDAHRVRTLSQVLMVVVNLDGQVARVETVAFREPPEYRPPQGWLDGFVGRGTRAGAEPDVDALTGATLTARATRGAVRRVLALHRIIDPWGPGP